MEVKALDGWGIMWPVLIYDGSEYAYRYDATGFRAGNTSYTIDTTELNLIDFPEGSTDFQITPEEFTGGQSAWEKVSPIGETLDLSEPVELWVYAKDGRKHPFFLMGQEKKALSEEEKAARIGLAERLKEENQKWWSKIDELESLKNEIQQAEQSYDLNKAAELKYGKLPQLQQQLEIEEEKVKGEDLSLVHESVNDEEIGRIVSRWTGIPVAKLNESERSKTLHLGDELHKRVIGQDEAVELVTEAIIRSKAGIKDPTKPIGSFLFLGPTGVGKTELAKALAENLFDDENNMVRIDMSEYMEKYSVSRLIGAPPGYVGFEEGGQLTEKIRKHPYSVILFDEIEKAHPDVFNIMLQILDDGILTDAQGRKVDFKNTVIIMTSNLGAKEILGNVSSKLGFKKDEEKDKNISEHDSIKNKVMEEVKRAFKPEFLNRIDDIIVFDRLTEDNIKEIAKLMLKSLEKRLNANEINVTFTESAVSKIAKSGFDPVYGARPLRRAIQRYVEDELSDMILKSELTNGKKVLVEYDKEQDKLVFNIQ